MNSHYYIGIGPLSGALRRSRNDLRPLSQCIANIIRDCGLEVMSDNITGFGNGGATLVWVLAESHVVLHLWYEEGFATVDIHVCDYTSSNAAKAADLKQRMQELCFDAGECRWEELLIPHPSQASVMGAVPPSKALHR